MKKTLFMVLLMLIFGLSSCSTMYTRININVETLEIVSVVVLETDGEIIPNPSDPDNFVIVYLHIATMRDEIETIMNGVSNEKVCGEEKCVSNNYSPEIIITLTDGINEFKISIGDQGNIVIIEKTFDSEGTPGFYYTFTEGYEEEVAAIYNTIIEAYGRQNVG